MSPLLLAFLAVLAGFVGLVWGADRFVDGAAAMAKTLGMSTLMIGLTIVSIGTSAPEILVAVSAALSQAGEMAIGNAIGSNIANIGLVLAVTVLISPITIQSNILRLEIPLLLAVTAMAGYCLLDHRLDRTEALLLIFLTIPVLYTIAHIHRSRGQSDNDELEIPEIRFSRSALLFFIGLVTLVISSKVLVWGAKDIASSLGVSELVIGLTVIAVGTSLPELAASVMSAIRGHHDIALGNVIGSNIFNLLLVMATPALVEPLLLDPVVLHRDYLAMAGLTLALASYLGICHWLARRQGKEGKLGLVAGVLLAVFYVAYIIHLMP